MPIFEYACSTCGKAFEHLARNSRESVPPCPKCGEKKTDKLLSTFSTSSGRDRSVPPCSEGACPAASDNQAQPCCGGACPLG
jgi:putative FmdB family regulatory protein